MLVADDGERRSLAEGGAQPRTRWLTFLLRAATFYGNGEGIKLCVYCA